MPTFEGHNGSPGNSLYIIVDYTVGSYNVSTNQTPVTMTMRLKHGSLYVSAGTNDCKLYAGGQTYSWTGPNFNTGPSTTTLGSHTFYVPHNADGTWSGTIGGEYKIGINYDGVYVGWITGSQKVTLPTIPRASDFSVGSITIGSNNTVSISRASGSFTHTVTLKLGTRSISASNAGTSATLAPPMEWCNGITSATSATGTMTVDTYNAGSKIGSKSKSVTVVVPSSVKPSVTIANSIVDGFGGYCLQSRSKVRLRSSGSGSYGSMIRSYSVSGAGYSSSSTDYTTGVFNTAGIKTFTVTVTDSRGRTGTASTSILVEPYFNPSITINTLCRCNSAGTPNESGNYIRVQASFLYTTFGSSSITNTLKHSEISYRERGASSFTGHTTIRNGVAATVFGGVLDPRKEYEIHIYIEDTVGGKASSINTISSSANYLIAAKQNCMGLLKYPDTSKSGVQVGGDLRADGTIYCETLSGSNGVQVNGTLRTNSAIYCETLSASKGFQPMWLSAAQDVNKVTNSGFFRLSDGPVNAPSGTAYGQLIVCRGGDTISQILMPYTTSKMYIRGGNPADVYGTGSWNPWKQVVTSLATDNYTRSYGQNGVLWNGTLLMVASQTITLSESVSSQPNGIVLVFSEFNSSTQTASGSGYHTYFVPKEVVKMFPGLGHSISWAHHDGSYYITKYVYINDTTIRGNNVNIGNKVQRLPSGITVSPDKIILDAVIGV